MNSVFDIEIVIPTIALACYCILLLILLRSRKSNITRMYSVYIFSNIIWSLGSLIMRTELYPGSLFWNRILCLGLISMPIVFYHFTLVFTQDSSKSKKLIFGYITAVILIIFNFLGFVVKDAYVVNNNFYYKLGIAAPVVAAWSSAYLVWALVGILKKVRLKEIPFNRVKLIVYGLILVIIGGLLNLLPRIGKYPVDIFTNVINAILIAYSIYRYKFLEIKLIIKKGIIYSLYTLILTGLYLSMVYIAENMLRNVIGYKALFTALITAFIIAFIFHPVRNKLQHWVDKIFYKDKLYQRNTLKNFSQIINNILDLDELADSLLKVIINGITANKASIMLKKDENKYYIFKSTNKTENLKNFIFRENNPVIKYLKSDKELLTIDEVYRLPYFKSLWEIEKEQLSKLEVELFIPVKLRNELIGLLLLAEKSDGEPYTQDDIDLLLTLVNSSAVAIENAQLYSKAKEEAITDGLTKLYNHRHFHETLDKIVKNNKVSTFSVIMIDVDNFKLYNDLYGHFEGDKALFKISNIIKKSASNEGIIARYGGEEFAILLPNLDENEALSISEKIRTSIENDFVSSNNMGNFLTVSLGIATFPNDTKKKEEILKCADIALYKAKRNGKNQSVVYSSVKDRGIHTIKDIHQIENMEDAIETAYSSAIYALAAAIDAKDHYTYNHSQNVSKFGVALATAAGLDAESIDIIKHAGLLHDIGKIGIPENILTKTSRLTDEEMKIMKKHVEISITMIKHVPSLLKVIPAILTHHERYDGTGYPRRIKGKNIPIEGRCLSIVDAFDAMTSERPYRKALTTNEALEEIRRNKGTQFDPELVDIFISLFEKGAMELTATVNT